MAASDPAREPMLKRTHPGDALDGSTIPEDTNAEILLHDGSWAWCRVIGQRKDRLGRWCVGIRWYPNATIGESGDWYIYEPGFIRRVNFDDLPPAGLRQNLSPGPAASDRSAGSFSVTSSSTKSSYARWTSSRGPGISRSARCPGPW